MAKVFYHRCERPARGIWKGEDRENRGKGSGKVGEVNMEETNGEEQVIRRVGSWGEGRAGRLGWKGL